MPDESILCLSYFDTVLGPNTFYCNNCSESLAELENMCWVCNTPFDKSKPVIPSKKIRRTIEEQTKSKL